MKGGKGVMVKGEGEGNALQKTSNNPIHHTKTGCNHKKTS